MQKPPLSPVVLTVLLLTSLVGWLVGWPFVGLGAAAAAVGGEPTRDGAWPLTPRPTVVSGFDPPDSPWGRGHRGVDLSGSAGQVVSTALPGTVSFVGVIAGRSVVVVSHGDTRTTYEPVVGTVAVGDRVARGAPIGRLELRGSHCLPVACLHWGWLRGEVYLNPLDLVGAERVRLLPLAGTAPLSTSRRAAVGGHGFDSGARVGLSIGLAEPIAGDMGVDLRRGHGGMTEELLDGAEVGAALQ